MTGSTPVVLQVMFKNSAAMVPLVIQDGEAKQIMEVFVGEYPPTKRLFHGFTLEGFRWALDLSTVVFLLIQPYQPQSQQMAPARPQAPGFGNRSGIH